MGEIAEMMLDGTLCAGCGVYLEHGEPEGVPRMCADCRAEPETARAWGMEPKRCRKRRRKGGPRG